MALIHPQKHRWSPLPHQCGPGPFINHIQPAIAVEWGLAGVEKHRGRANSLNNSRLAVFTDECDTLWILFALVVLLGADKLTVPLRKTSSAGCRPFALNGFSASIFTHGLTWSLLPALVLISPESIFIRCLTLDNEEDRTRGVVLLETIVFAMRFTWLYV